MKCKYILTSSIFFFLSCQKNDSQVHESLSLMVENKTIVIKDTLSYNHRMDKEEYIENHGCVIKYKLVNNTDKKILFLFNPNKINYELINSKGDNVPFTGGGNPSFGTTNRRECDFINDSITITHYNNLGYRKDSAWIYRSAYIQDNYHLIHPKEVLFFESYITLPVIFGDGGWYHQYHNFKNSEKYFFKISFLSKISDIEELTEGLSKTVKNNDYELYNNLLESDTIPIIFE